MEQSIIIQILMCAEELQGLCLCVHSQVLQLVQALECFLGDGFDFVPLEDSGNEIMCYDRCHKARSRVRTYCPLCQQLQWRLD